MSRPRSCCIIPPWTLGPDSPLTVRLKAASYVTSVIRCLTNPKYAVKNGIPHRQAQMRFLADSIVVPIAARLVGNLLERVCNPRQRNEAAFHQLASLHSFVPVI